MRIQHVETAFRHSYGIDPFESLSPNTVLRNLAAEMTNLRHNIRALQDDLSAFKDIKKLKLGLKSFKLEPRVPDFDLMPF